MKHLRRTAIVERGATEIFALVEAIEAYPEFLPWCEDARVRERTPGRTVATISVGVAGVRLSFTTENANVPGQSIHMRLLEGPFRRFTAAWRFTPLGAHAAKIEFTIDYEFLNRAAGTVLEPVFSRIADSMVEAFARRARNWHGKAAR